MASLRPFQREDVEKIKSAGLRALVASSPGTGKTLLAARALAETAPASVPALIVCPASVVFNWRKELNRWAPNLSVDCIENGTDPIPAPRWNTVYVISWALLDARWPDFVACRVRTVVADEAHFARNVHTLRSQALWHLTRSLPHLLLLTGTPIVNTEEELEVLKEMLGKDPLMIRRLLEEVAPDVPPKSRSYLPVELPEKAQDNYDKANTEFEEWLVRERAYRHEQGLTDIEIERTLAAEALTKVGYLRRIVGEGKVKAAVDWLSRSTRVGEPVVVFMEHQNVLNKLSKGLRKARVRHGIIDGSSSTRERQEAVEGFQANRFPVLLCTRAAKEGITLTAARHLLFVERFFTSADEEQAEDRIRRLGQKYPTTIWYLHVPGTIDDRVDEIVRHKRGIIKTAIGSAETAETPTQNVLSLLQTWNEHIEHDIGPVTSLGLSEPLPPLPSPKETHGIVFTGERWGLSTATRWCKMNGYRPLNIQQYEGRFKLIIHPPTLFVPNTFGMFSVSRDIKVVTGRRLSKANERRVQLAMRVH